MSARPITDTLRFIGGGTFIDKASDALADLVNAVESSGKKGTLTLTITVAKATRNSVKVGGQIKLATPKEDPLDALLFPTPEGNLLAEDPSQTRLDLRVASTPGVNTLLTANGGNTQ